MSSDNLWTNFAFDFSEEILGSEKFGELLRKKREASPNCVQNVLGQRALSLASHEAIKKIRGGKRSAISPILRRHNAVGAVGYAYVSDDNRLQDCDFFKPGRCFKIRFRASNVNCEDDAASCIREIAIKFSDQDKDGLFDLFLYTGRTFMARDCGDFLKLLNSNGTDKEIQQLCRNNPYTYRSLADGLRRAPTSFADMTYYSQICYLFSVVSMEKTIVKFRLIPSSRTAFDFAGSEFEQKKETGMLNKDEQKELWMRSRSKTDTVDQNYLKQEFKRRLWKDEPISFTLQVQMKPFYKGDLEDCNPQLIWDENEFPWSRLMVIELTTHMTSLAIARTSFNISDTPKGLGFPLANSSNDPFSLQKVMMSVYTEIERKGLSQIYTPLKEGKRHEKTITSYVVSVWTEPLKENKQVPYVEVHVTLWGWRCRSCAISLNLDNRIRSCVTENNLRVNQHRFESESVGELINITVDVYHRHLMESWYLREVEVCDENLKTLWSFPCYEVVEGSITLEPGDVTLVQNQKAMVSKKERVFQLNNRQLEYGWHKVIETKKDPFTRRALRMPGQIRNPSRVDKLPIRHRTRADKFTGIRWEVDPKLIEFFREFHSSVMTHGSLLTKKLKAKMKKSKSQNSQRKATPRAQRVGADQRDSHETKPKRHPFNKLMSHDIHFFSGKKLTDGNRIYNNLFKNTNHYKNSANVRPQEDLPKLASKPTMRFKSSSVSETDYRPPQGFSEVDYSHFESDLDSKLPEGSLGDMCRTVLNDYNFGRLFLIGPNPTVIERCHTLPANFPVTDEMVCRILGYSRTLEDEIQAGRIYMADYKILSGLSTVHHEADHRFIAAPMVLLHSQESGDLVPLAIQLEQVPSHDNPIWTPESRPEAWMLAKLWVRCCDFNHQFAVSHLFNCHFLMEPFLVATMRCLPSNHPCYKILMPHFRYLLVSNTLIRRQVLSENGSVDRHTSLGRRGFLQLMGRHWREFNFDQLNPIKSAKKRGVTDKKLLPGYLYRDDSQGLFNCIHECCSELIKAHYKNPEDYSEDSELKSWLLELIDFGFPGHLMTCPYSSSLQLVPSAPPLSPEFKTFDFDIIDEKTTPDKVQEEKENDPKDGQCDYDEVDIYFKGDDDDDECDPYEMDDTDYSERSQQKKAAGERAPAINYSLVKKTRGKKYTNTEMLKVSNPEELAEMLAVIVFTVTCQHSATHSDAMDLFGFVPDVPAMMRKSPNASNLNNINVDVLTQTLPDQYPEAYYASLLFILNVYKPDQNILGEMDEVYFVDEKSLEILKTLKKNLRELTTMHRARNINCGIKYECLVPQFITTSPEPLPYIQSDVLEKATRHLGPTMTVNTFIEQMSTGTVSPFVLEQCLTFHETLGGRSSRGLLDETFLDESLRHNFQKMRHARKNMSISYASGDDYRSREVRRPSAKKLPSTAEEKRLAFRSKIMSDG